MNQAQASIACVGLRAKTGRAVGVVLAGPLESPQPITRTELVLASLEQPSLFQPYHVASPKMVMANGGMLVERFTNLRNMDRPMVCAIASTCEAAGIALYLLQQPDLI